jgi:hypothetical protein
MASLKQTAISTTALTAALAAGAGTATTIITVAQGETTGAPGFSKALSRVGKAVGGTMQTGVGVIGASAALSGILVYQTIKLLEG